MRNVKPHYFKRKLLIILRRNEIETQRKRKRGREIKTAGSNEIVI